jgi:hypothetical protein
MVVSVISEGRRNPGCPIKYRMNLSAELLGALPGLAHAAAGDAQRRS